MPRARSSPQGPVVGRGVGTAEPSRFVLGAMSTAGGSGRALESIPSLGAPQHMGEGMAALEKLIRHP